MSCVGKSLVCGRVLPRVAGPIDQQDDAVSLPLPFEIPHLDLLCLRNSYVLEFQLRPATYIPEASFPDLPFTAGVSLCMLPSEQALHVYFLQKSWPDSASYSHS